MSYSAWAKKRKEQQMTLERKVALRKEKIETLQEYAGHGFRYGGSSSQIGKMKQKLKESKKLEEEGADEAKEMADLVEDAELPLTLHAGGILKNSIAKLENVSFAYPGEGNPTLFAGVDMNLDSKSRVCLLGENGEGKTTLVKTMLGELQPTAGQVTLDRGARVALVNQHHAEQLQYDMTPLAFMIDKFPGDGSYRHEQDVRGHLSGCGIPNAQQVVPSGALSGGATEPGSHGSRVVQQAPPPCPGRTNKQFGFGSRCSVGGCCRVVCRWCSVGLARPIFCRACCKRDFRSRRW